MELLKFPHPSLFTKCQPVTVFGKEIKILMDSMWDTMLKANGLGLSANQVGIHYRAFCMIDENKQRVDVINPTILKSSNIAANLAEGCLSSPGEFLVVPGRPSWVQIEFQDLEGNLHKRTFKEIHSVCVLHEISHLNGESFMEHPSIPKAKRKELKKKWKLK